MADLPLKDRVRNGQRAAACALMLAGVPYIDACGIAGVSLRAMKKLIRLDWRKRPSPPTRWTPAVLADLKADWRHPKMPTKDIAAKYRITPARLCQIAREHSWGPRVLTPDPKSPGQQPREVQLWYRRKRDVYGPARARELLHQRLEAGR